MANRGMAARAAGRLAIGACALLLVHAGQAQALAAPAPQPSPATAAAPAIDGLFAAFRSRPLVGMSDAHGLAQELDLYAAIIRDPRFAAEVGNLVVEFGGAAHQAVIDRYVSGETVPYVELRRVWTDVVGWVPTANILGFMNVFASVRAVNMALPPEQRIRVWLGEPPIDWSKVNSQADLAPISARRDSFPAELIRREILARNKKALVIYGGAHLLRERDVLQKDAPARVGTEAAVVGFYTGMAEGAPSYEAMAPRLAEAMRRLAAGVGAEVATYGPLLSTVYRGRDLDGADVYDMTFTQRKIQVMIRLDADGKMDGIFYRTLNPGGSGSLVDLIEAGARDTMFVVAPYAGYADKACADRFEAALREAPVPALVQAPALFQEQRAAGCRGDGGLSTAQAVLWLGPAAGLTRSPTHPDIYLDEEYRRELSRRNQIMTGQPFTAAPQMQTFQVSPRKFGP